VTLAPYVDQSSYRIPRSFSLERGFHLFRAMGLSHITVVDKDNRVVGILSRKDLTSINIERKLEKLKQAEHAAHAAHAGDEERGRDGRPSEAGGPADAPRQQQQQQGVGGGSISSGSEPRSAGGVPRSVRAVADTQLQESHSEAIALAGLDQGILI